MEFRKKRWISLFAGFVIEALAGVAYAWSVFQTPLIDKYGWSVSKVSFAFTLSFLVGMIGSLLVGAKLKQKLKIRTEVLIGGIFYGGGLFLMQFIRGSVLELYLYFGIISAVGNFMVYPVLISYALELFPEKTGFAGGIMTAGFGLGAVIWAPLTTAIYTSTGDISNAFFFLGILFMVGIVVLSRLLFTPPEGFRDEMVAGAKTVETKKSRGVVYEVGKDKMLKLPMFYLMMLSLLIGLACGGMIVNQGSPIMQLQFGLTATAAAVIVSFLSVSNTIGRIVWGALSDRIGKVNTLIGVHICMAVFMVLLLTLKNQTAFTAALLGTTFCYGGVACLVAPTTEELFGGKNIGANYSVSFCAFGLSSLIGPTVIASIRQSTGAYTLGYVFAAVISVIALALTIIIALRAKALQKQSS